MRTVQRWTINPLMRALLAAGLNPLGLAILETRGRRSGRQPAHARRQRTAGRIVLDHRRTRSAGRLLAKHRERSACAGTPARRVALPAGLPGIATVLTYYDPLARQRRIIRWHPLCALNAINVRVLGADLVTVHVRLQLGEQPCVPPGQDHPATAVAA